MLVSLTTSAANTNTLWVDKPNTCDSCTHFDSDFWVYPVSATDVQALEYDNFIFDKTDNLEIMFGSQYCYAGTACPGGANGWDIWNQNAGAWVATGITAAPSFGAWNRIHWSQYRVIGDTSCSGTECEHYVNLTLNGTTYAVNMTEPAGPLPSGWTSALGFQFQLDSASVSGTNTLSEYIDEASFIAY